MTARAELVAREPAPECCRTNFARVVDEAAGRGRLPPIFWTCGCSQIWSRDADRFTWLRAKTADLSLRQFWAHLLRIVDTRSLLEDDDTTIVAVLELARACREPTDVDLMKVRSFAASAGDTIAAAEALSVIRGLAARKVRS